MPRNDDLDFILSTEFPKHDLFRAFATSNEVPPDGDFSGFLGMDDAEVAMLNNVLRRYRELNVMADSAIAQIASEIREQEEQKTKEKKDKEREYEASLRENEESLRTIAEQEFGLPHLAADFSHFVNLALWSPHEAACLLSGKDPRRLDRSQLSRLRNAPSAMALESFTDRLEREARAGTIGSEGQIKPSRLLQWAMRAKVNVPPKLQDAISKAKGEALIAEVETPPTELSPCTPLEASNAALQNKINFLEAKLRTDTAAHTRWRGTTLRILWGLLHANLKGPVRERPATVKEAETFSVSFWRGPLTSKLYGPVSKKPTN